MKRFCRFAAFLLAAVRLSLTASGDVNGDGRVDVADIARATAILNTEIPYEAAADLDGDASVSETDVWLIQEAALGRPVLEQVDSALIGPAGGTLSHGALSLTVPPGAASSRTLTLFRCADETPDPETALQQIYLLSGLSPDLPGVSVQFSAATADTGPAIASFIKPHDAGEPQWRWHVLPETAFSRNGSLITCSLPAPVETGLGIDHSVKLALNTTLSPPPPSGGGAALPMSEPLSDPLSDPPAGGGGDVPGSRYAGYRYTGWISDHFHVYTKDWSTVTYTDLESVCGALYSIYATLETIGFPLSSTHAGIFPLEVHVVKGMTDDGGFVTNPVTGQWVEVSADLLTRTAELKATLGHELMHYVLKEYNRGDSYAFANIEDSITTWFEAAAAANPAHRSGNYTVRRAAPLKSLFHPVTTGWLGGGNWEQLEQHGYGTSAFIDYWFNTNRAWIYDLAQKVQAGQSIEDALDNLFTENGGPLQDLERRYLQFARDYLASAPGTYSADVYPDVIFSNDSKTDTVGMYRLFSIKKASPTLLDEVETPLKVQDYGCGVLQFKLFKPDRLFAPLTKLRVTGPPLLNSLDILMLSRDASKNITSQTITGIFGPNGEGEDEWSCEFLLPDDAEYILFSVLATVGNEGLLTNWTETHDVTLTHQFIGDYYMPRSEQFIQYTQLDTRTVFYQQQIYTDAAFRVLAPAETADFLNFNFDRSTVDYPQPDQNFRMNYAGSHPSANRKTPDAFQLRIFSNASVPTLPPFTIDIDPDPEGYYAWNGTGQTPMPAGDTSPQFELMVYEYPAAEASLLVPGTEAYRIQHITTSADNLRMSADGLSGGALIDIPAHTGDRHISIYVYAKLEGDPSTHLAYVFTLLPPPEVTP